MNSSAIRKIARESPDIIWFVARASVLRGPFTTEQLQQQLKSRDISYLDFCWRQGFYEWRPIGSIEDFDQRSRLKSLPLYPSVEVPCGPAPSAAPASGDYKDSGRSQTLSTVRPKPVQVSFARNKRHSISIYEWGLAAIFSVIFAYFCADFALHEVSKTLTENLQLLTSGVPQKMGELAEGEHPSNPLVWQPLYSAPSYTDVAVEHSYPDQELPLLNLPTVLESTKLKTSNGVTSMESYTLESPGLLLPLWTSQQNGLDPVYVKSVMIRGHLAGHNARAIDVHLPGDPRRF